MKTLSAVLVQLEKPLILAELEIPPLRRGQVLVEVAYSGVCHTQILESRGHRGNDPYLPHCLGHEGSGIVSEIGEGVTKVKPGDQVILSWMKGSGEDVNSATYQWNGSSVNAGAITTFSRYSVISDKEGLSLPFPPSGGSGSMPCAAPGIAARLIVPLCRCCSLLSRY